MYRFVALLAVAAALSACHGKDAPATPAAPKEAPVKLAPKPPKPPGGEQAPELSPEAIKALQARSK